MAERARHCSKYFVHVKFKLHHDRCAEHCCYAHCTDEETEDQKLPWRSGTATSCPSPGQTGVGIGPPHLWWYPFLKMPWCTGKASGGAGLAHTSHLPAPDGALCTRPLPSIRAGRPLPRLLFPFSCSSVERVRPQGGGSGACCQQGECSGPRVEHPGGCGDETRRLLIHVGVCRVSASGSLPVKWE